MMRLEQKLADLKKVRWRTLARGVMAVAVEGGCKDWACYIGVATKTGIEGAEQVYNDGDKQWRYLAEVLFPDFKEAYIYRS
ncbi:hypothetical protein ES703_54624 [subsurface metagenome]